MGTGAALISVELKLSKVRRSCLDIELQSCKVYHIKNSGRRNLSKSGLFVPIEMKTFVGPVLKPAQCGL